MNASDNSSKITDLACAAICDVAINLLDPKFKRPYLSDPAPLLFIHSS